MKQHRSLLALVAFAAAPLHAVTVDFTAPDYSDGALDTQDSWVGALGDVSNSGGTGELLLSTSSGFINGTYFDANLSGVATSYTVSSTFSFTLDSALPSGNNNIYRLQFARDDISATNQVETGMFLQYNTTAGGYRLNASTDLTGSTSFNTGSALTEASLGLDSANSDFTSDSLTMSYTIFRNGSTVNDWSFEGTLMNGLSTLDTISGSMVVSTAFNEVSLIDAGINTMQLNSSNANISSFTAENWSATAIPEPSTYSLLFGAATGLLCMLRRRK